MTKHKQNLLYKLDSEIQQIEKEKPNSTKKHTLIEIKDYLTSRYEFRKNKLTLELEVRPIGDDDFVLLDDGFINSMWYDLQIDGYKVSDATLIKLLNNKHTNEYNPLKAYFYALPKYDGHDYIQDLADTIEIADINASGVSLRQLWKPYLEKWLVASTATAIGRGINHTCLIFVGGQGVGKTSWLNNLCPKEMRDFLVCSHINPSLTDQNTANFLAEKWFVNVDDQLETIFGKDFNSMKAIITAPFVNNRKTWHRFGRKRQRVCSFMGSVNNPKFLTDSENRRYLVFTADTIDFKNKVDMNKVWAQALYKLKGGYQYWFSQEETSILNKINDFYRQVPPEEEWLMKLYQPCEATDPNAKFVMPSEMLSRINAWSGLRLSIRKLSNAMDKLDFGKKISKRIEGQPRNVYPVIERSDTDETQYQNEMKREFE